MNSVLEFITLLTEKELDSVLAACEETLAGLSIKVNGKQLLKNTEPIQLAVVYKKPRFNRDEGMYLNIGTMPDIPESKIPNLSDSSFLEKVAAAIRKTVETQLSALNFLHEGSNGTFIREGKLHLRVSMFPYALYISMERPDCFF